MKVQNCQIVAVMEDGTERIVGLCNNLFVAEQWIAGVLGANKDSPEHVKALASMIDKDGVTRLYMNQWIGGLERGSWEYSNDLACSLIANTRAA